MNRRIQKPQDQTLLHTTGAGQPLETETRAVLEPRFGHDFSKVRVHADPEADSITRAFQARALAFGEALFFRDGAYDPTSSAGMYTLAHELTHVVQQSGSRKNGFSDRVDSRDSRSEAEAHGAARAVMTGQHPSVTPGSVSEARVARLDEGEPEPDLAAVTPMLPPPMPDMPNPNIPKPPIAPNNIPGLPRVPPTGGIGLGAGIAAGLAGLLTWLWPNKTAPRWMDEMNPLTGQPYASEQEFQEVQQEMRRRTLEEHNAGTPSGSSSHSTRDDLPRADKGEST